MSKKEKNASLPAGESAKQPSSKTQKRVAFLCAVALVVTLVFVGLRNVVTGYYDTFVLHGTGSDSAMVNIEPLNYDTTEQSPLASLQTQWDLYRTARLEERVTVTTEDGVTLSGLLYDEGSAVTVIALHDFNGSADGDFLYATLFEEIETVNLLLPDSRAHGESGGDYVSYGYYEADDLLKWVDWVIDRYGNDQRIVIYGDTMGAAAALMAASRLPENVKLIIAESPYASLEEMAKYELKKWYRLPSPFLTFIQWQSDAGYTLDDVIVSDTVKDASIPTIFLAGTDDTFIPDSMTRAVYYAYGGEKELVEVSAQHGLLYATDPDKVKEAISRWWNDLL